MENVRLIRGLKELDKIETSQISGGNNLAWAIGSYVVGKVLDYGFEKNKESVENYSGGYSRPWVP